MEQMQTLVCVRVEGFPREVHCLWLVFGHASRLAKEPCLRLFQKFFLCTKCANLNRDEKKVKTALSLVLDGSIFLLLDLQVRVRLLLALDG